MKKDFKIINKMRKKYLFIVYCLLFLSFPLQACGEKNERAGTSESFVDQQVRSFVRSVWMWGSVLSNEPIQSVIDKLYACHINQVFLLVKGTSGTKTSEDKLKEFVRKAHKAKIEVHFWYIVNSDKLYIDANPNACIYHCPKPPENSRSYPVNDERVNLLYPGYKEYVLENIRYYLKNFECDGVHLDYIRYSHFVYSFDTHSLKKAATAGCDTIRLLNLFNTEANYTKYATNNGFLDLYKSKDENVVKWIEMRKNVLSDYMQSIKNIIAQLRPGILLSAAFMPEGVTDVDYSDVFYAQNYASHSNFLGMISPMSYFKSYEEPTNWLQKISQEAPKKVNDSCKIYTAIQTFGGVTPQQVDEQIQYCYKGGADGMVIFRYGTTTEDSWDVIQEWDEK